ncbi:MAG: hypothetical protein ACHBN1_36980 [Heteroscytonema crispum UTEX LB 1556]
MNDAIASAGNRGKVKKDIFTSLLPLRCDDLVVENRGIFRLLADWLSWGCLASQLTISCTSPINAHQINFISEAKTRETG